MAVRKAEAEWKGNVREGAGSVKLGSGAFEGPFSFVSRFESGGGTNPEELIGAAHAACFTMSISAACTRAGLTPTRLHTRADVHIEKVGEGFQITHVDLDTVGEVPGIDEAKFLEIAQTAKTGCPVSKALAGTEIRLTARLISGVRS